jgi:hypothetical protein
MNTYGDVVTDEMTRAASKVAGLAIKKTDHKRITSRAKAFVLAEASVSRTHRRQETCRPPVLKTGRITGPHALPYLSPMRAYSFCSALRIADYFGCATVRRYGLCVLKPAGYFCLACSSETEVGMITSLPGFQFTGVATLCLAVS